MMSSWKILLELWLCSALLLHPSLCCFQCFIQDNHTKYGPNARYAVCSNYTGPDGVGDLETCVGILKIEFDYNDEVIESARVGKSDLEDLKTIMDNIYHKLKDFNRETHTADEYNSSMQNASREFIHNATTQLSRARECSRTCGFQSTDEVNNCETCNTKDSCGLPVDCPTENAQVTEYQSIRMWCEPNVTFRNVTLPEDARLVWKFAAGLNTTRVGRFRTVTAGQDPLFSIPAAGDHHQGTYQCEILQEEKALFRLYWYLAVTPKDASRHEAMQELFDLAMLPAGRLVPAAGPRPGPDPSAVLLTATMTSVQLFFYLSAGTAYWMVYMRGEEPGAADDRDPRRPSLDSDVVSSSSSEGVVTE